MFLTSVLTKGGITMAKKVTAYEVPSLSSVDTKYYVTGDIFITKRSIGVLMNGRIRTLEMDKPDLSQYVKKSEVQKMIQKELKADGKV